MAKLKVQFNNYRELSQELAEIVAKLEQGELDIDAAVKGYERGLEIVTILESQLLKAENQVAELKAATDPSAED